MSFELPSVLPDDKDLSVNTQKAYKSRLNALAKENPAWSNVAALKKNAKEICAHIDTLADDSEKGRVKKRGVLQAIFSVFELSYRKTKNTYYRYYQTVLPITSKDGSAWVTRKNYVEPKD